MPLVVGAGPAGSVAALVLARAGVRVALIDKAAFPRDKACGDLIGPRGVQILDDLGIERPGGRVGDMEVVGPTGRRRAAAGLSRASPIRASGWSCPGGASTPCSGARPSTPAPSGLTGRAGVPLFDGRRPAGRLPAGGGDAEGSRCAATW